MYIKKRKVNEGMSMCIAGFAGQRARVPPDPIPNSEVKPRSVPNCSVVFGHVNQRKLAPPFIIILNSDIEDLKFITMYLVNSVIVFPR